MLFMGKYFLLVLVELLCLFRKEIAEHLFTPTIFFTFFLPPIMLEAGYFLPKKVLKLCLFFKSTSELGFFGKYWNDFDLRCCWNDLQRNRHWIHPLRGICVRVDARTGRWRRRYQEDGNLLTCLKLNFRSGGAWVSTFWLDHECCRSSYSDCCI